MVHGPCHGIESQWPCWATSIKLTGKPIIGVWRCLPVHMMQVCMWTHESIFGSSLFGSSSPCLCMWRGGQLHIPLLGISPAWALACCEWRAARVQERIHECIAFALTGMHSPASLLPACLLPPSSCSFATRKTYNKCTAVRCLKTAEIYRNATHCVVRWRKVQSILKVGKDVGRDIGHWRAGNLPPTFDPDKSCWLNSISKKVATGIRSWQKLPVTFDPEKNCRLHSILAKVASYIRYQESLFILPHSSLFILSLL